MGFRPPGNGGGGGLNDVVDDTSPQLGGNLDVNGKQIVSVANGDIILNPSGTGKVGIDETSPDFKLDIIGTIGLTEQAAADPDVAGKGQIWVKNDSPNVLYFTDDTGTDHDLLSGGASAINDLTDVTITGPADNEVLAYDFGSSEWINQTPAEAGLAEASHTHVEADITDLGSYLENVVEDTTPALGGNLDGAGFSIDDIDQLTVKQNGATPFIGLIDSDTTDGDLGVTFTASATDTGSGTEDVDYLLQQQINGTLSTIINADADGDINLGRSTAIDGPLTIDTDNAEALLVRADGDAGDVLTVDTVDLRVGIGGAPSQKLTVTDSNAGSGTTRYATSSNETISSGTQSVAWSSVLGSSTLSGSSISSGTGASSASGAAGVFNQQSTGTVAEAGGVYGGFQTAIAAPIGTVTNAYGVVGQIVHTTTGTITSGGALTALSPTNSGGGTITNLMGLDIQDVTGGTNNFSIRTGLGKAQIGQTSAGSSVEFALLDNTADVFLIKSTDNQEYLKVSTTNTATVMNYGQSGGSDNPTHNFYGGTRFNSTDNIVLDDNELRFGSDSDIVMKFDSGSDFWRLDNTSATGSTRFMLGTDTSATDFRVQNDSGTNILQVQGDSSTTVTGSLELTGNITGAPSAVGRRFHVDSSTYTDNDTAASGTAFFMTFNSLEEPTLAATNASVTTTVAANFQVAGMPQAGTNMTITNAACFLVGNANGYTTNADEGGFGFIAFPPGIEDGVGDVDTLGGFNVQNPVSGSVSLGNQTATLSDFFCGNYDAITLVSTTNTRTITKAATVRIKGAPIASTNVSFSNTPYALLVDGDQSKFNSRLMMNLVSIPSADEITLTDGNIFDMTGTTTINHINKTNWDNGSVITLRFNGNITITHNAGGLSGTETNILLAGGSNYSATSGDNLTLMKYDDNTWEEISRTVI